MRLRLTLILSLVLVAAACSGGDGDETTTTTTVPLTTTTVAPVTLPPTTVAPTTTTSSTTTTTLPIEDLWPLTGEAGFVEASPVLFVKIDNTSRGRPQAGLDQADLVFEIVVEGGIPRLLVAFQSEIPELAGPVRSVRETDAKLLYPFAPYFANSGGQSFVREMVNDVSRDAGHPRLGRPQYIRESGRPAVYDLMVRAPGVLERLNPLPRENEVRLTFGAPLDEGVPAGDVDLSMSNSQTSSWDWAADEGRYLRSNNGSPHEAASGERIGAANVLALEVDQILLERTDSAGSRVPDYRLVGSGPLTLFRDGMAYAGTWERDNLRAWFRFLGPDGAELPLAVGNTWIELIPSGRAITYS